MLLNLSGKSSRTAEHGSREHLKNEGVPVAGQIIVKVKYFLVVDYATL